MLQSLGIQWEWGTQDSPEQGVGLQPQHNKLISQRFWHIKELPACAEAFRGRKSECQGVFGACFQPGLHSRGCSLQQG